MSTTNKMSYKKAGILIIGDEILKGHINDTNSGYMCKKFHAIGVKVCRIVTVPDNVEDIAEEVAKLSKKYNIVVTSGGIGPTHDDITYEGVAKGLNDKIILHEEMADVINSYFPSCDENNPALKMALIPQSSKLIYILPKESDGRKKPKTAFPIVQVGNVYVLPGMTEWLEHAFDHLQKVFQNPDVNVYVMKLFVNSSEFKIINELNEAVEKYEETVIFGSYPSVAEGDFKTKITLESSSLDDVCSAYSHLKSLLPSGFINSEMQMKDVESVYELTNGISSLGNAVADAIKVIEDAYEKYKPHEIYLSFNGGKDCTVLLHLVWAVSKKLNGGTQINTLYVRSDDPFEEVDDFIKQSAERYNLNLTTVNGSIKTELENLTQNHAEIKAMFIGTRRTDPHSEKLKTFQMCDPSWPQIMRVNPLLDWSYHDIWEFLRLLAVPYCSLYDEGYTSLGNVKNTRPNPALEIANQSNGIKKYDPAFKLKDGRMERQGRG